jgi:hypothetical protein
VIVEPSNVRKVKSSPVGSVRLALHALRREALDFRFDYPLEPVPEADTPGSLRYHVYSDRLFFDMMELDPDGIAVHRTRTFGPIHNPAYVGWYGLVHLERWVRGLDPEGREVFRRQLAWLVEHAQPWVHDAMVWPYGVELTEGKCVLRPPWISAMAQGLAISALVRGYRLDGEPALLHLARSATRVFGFLIEAGGVASSEAGHRLYEEYPCYPLPRVLDGFLFSLLGLHDLWSETKDPVTEELFQGGVRGLVHKLPHWNYRSKWSWYGDHAYLCPTHYHRLNTILLEAVGRLADEPVLVGCADNWDSSRLGIWDRAEIRTVFFLTKNWCRFRHRTWRRRNG